MYRCDLLKSSWARWEKVSDLQQSGIYTVRMAGQQKQHNGRPAERLQILSEDASGLMSRLRTVELALGDEEKKSSLPWYDKKNKKVVACLQVPLSIKPHPCVLREQIH